MASVQGPCECHEIRVQNYLHLESRVRGMFAFSFMNNLR